MIAGERICRSSSLLAASKAAREFDSEDFIYGASSFIKGAFWIAEGCLVEGRTGFSGPWAAARLFVTSRSTFNLEFNDEAEESDLPLGFTAS